MEIDIEEIQMDYRILSAEMYCKIMHHHEKKWLDEIYGSNRGEGNE